MLYITLQQNKRKKYSFIIILVKKGKRKIIRKLGKFYYNKNLNKYILSINFIVLNKLLIKGINISFDFYKIIYKYSSVNF